jgi:hypothetical protein
MRVKLVEEVSVEEIPIDARYVAGRHGSPKRRKRAPMIE